MNTFKHLLIVSSAALIFNSCGSNNAGNQHDGAEDKTSSYNIKCFEAFDYDYRKMLSKEDVLRHVSVSNPDGLEVNFKESRISKKHNEYIIKWPSGRPDMNMEVKAGGTTMTIPQQDDNIISVEQLEFKDDDAKKVLDNFNRAYAKLSDADYKEMENKIDKQYADKSEEERRVMKSMIRTREKMVFHPVAGVGSGAYWEREEMKGVYLGTNLYVLSGTMQFRIKVKVGHDDQENARIAALLAKEVLDKCK